MAGIEVENGHAACQAWESENRSEGGVAFARNVVPLVCSGNHVGLSYMPAPHGPGREWVTGHSFRPLGPIVVSPEPQASPDCLGVPLLP